MLGGCGLEQRPVDGNLDVIGNQPLEDLHRIGLVVDRHPALWLGIGILAVLLGVLVLEQGRPLEREQRLVRHDLRDRRDVAVVEDLDLVDLVVEVGRHQALGDPARIGVRRSIGKAGEALDQIKPAEPQRRGGTPTRCEVDDLAPVGLVLAPGRDARPDDVRVEAPGQSAIARTRAPSTTSTPALSNARAERSPCSSPLARARK